MTFTWICAMYAFASKHGCLHKEEIMESLVNQIHSVVLPIKGYLSSQGNGGVGY